MRHPAIATLCSPMDEGLRGDRPGAAAYAAMLIRDAADEIVTVTMDQFSTRFPSSVTNRLPPSDYTRWVHREVEAFAAAVETGEIRNARYTDFYGQMVLGTSRLTSQVIDFVESRILLAEVVLAVVWRRAMAEPGEVAAAMGQIEDTVLRIVRANLRAFSEDGLRTGALTRHLDVGAGAEPDGATPPPGQDSATTLSLREREVLRLISEGRTNGQIASELFLSENTVKHHVSHLLDKLGANNRAELVSRSLGPARTG